MADIVLRDVSNAGLVVSDRIGRDVAAQTDLEEALEASRYASHPYTTHPREVSENASSSNMYLCYYVRVAVSS